MKQTFTRDHTERTGWSRGNQQTGLTALQILNGWFFSVGNFAIISGTVRLYEENEWVEFAPPYPTGKQYAGNYSATTGQISGHITSAEMQSDGDMRLENKWQF